MFWGNVRIFVCLSLDWHINQKKLRLLLVQTLTLFCIIHRKFYTLADCWPSYRLADQLINHDYGCSVALLLSKFVDLWINKSCLQVSFDNYTTAAQWNLAMDTKECQDGEQSQSCGCYIEVFRFRSMWPVFKRTSTRINFDFSRRFLNWKFQGNTSKCNLSTSWGDPKNFTS